MKVNKTLWRWSRLLHIYAAVALLFLLSFFALTGISLNHPDWFVGAASEHELGFQLENFSPSQGLNFSPEQILQIEQQLEIRFSKLKLEQDGELLFIDSQMPGAFVSGELNLNNGKLLASRTDYGAWAWLNDLHKGRNSGSAWKLLLDVSSVLILLFCLSGLVLLLPNRRYLKPATYLGILTASLCGAVLLYL